MDGFGDGRGERLRGQIRGRIRRTNYEGRIWGADLGDKGTDSGDGLGAD